MYFFLTLTWFEQANENQSLVYLCQFCQSCDCLKNQRDCSCLKGQLGVDHTRWSLRLLFCCGSKEGIPVHFVTEKGKHTQHVKTTTMHLSVLYFKRFETIFSDA